MSAQLTTIDLRDKSLEEVAGILESRGFSVSKGDITDVWDARDGKRSPVQIIWIDNEQSHLLIVTIFNGRRVALDPGMDLHLFDRPKDQLVGQDWSAIRTMDMMR